ncbi:MAG: hypothetical protein JSV97_08645 [candidate division WOR-3 bacterium]|nr:MAG: hypothetical protein JSV97_08645 [candidate division WOR-3 bacterium]
MNIVIILVALWDYSYSVTARVTYDNNIFAYSQEYIDDFMNHVRPYRFPFETHDDLITSGNMHLYLRNKFFGNKTTTFHVDVLVHHYLINHQKDYQRIDVGIRQSFGAYAVRSEYQIIPRYLIRYYRKTGGSRTEYIGCEVAYHTIYGKVSWRALPHIELDVRYRRRWENFISEFDMYDANSHTLGIGAHITLKKRLALSLGYDYRTSQTDSAALLSAPDEDTPDGSYNQHAVQGRLTYQLKFFLPTTLDLGYDYTFRDFTTSASTDSLHFSRQDHLHKFSIATQLKIFVGMSFNISYTFQLRNATSEILSGIDRIKDYNKYRFSAGLNFYH